MAYTIAQKKAIYKYCADKVKIQLLVSSEQRERYRSRALSLNKSLSQYIIDCVERDMGKE